MNHHCKVYDFGFPFNKRNSNVTLKFYSIGFIQCIAALRPRFYSGSQKLYLAEEKEDIHQSSRGDKKNVFFSKAFVDDQFKLSFERLIIHIYNFIFLIILIHLIPNREQRRQLFLSGSNNYKSILSLWIHFLLSELSKDLLLCNNFKKIAFRKNLHSRTSPFQNSSRKTCLFFLLSEKRHYFRYNNSILAGKKRTVP